MTVLRVVFQEQRAQVRSPAVIRARCDTCHSGPYLTDTKQYNLGLARGPGEVLQNQHPPEINPVSCQLQQPDEQAQQLVAAGRDDRPLLPSISARVTRPSGAELIHILQ